MPTEVTMSAPTADALDLLHRRIIATNAALHGAKAAFAHSPNAQNEAAVETATRRLNELLDRLPRSEPDTELAG
jgi:hypothetical protein